MDLCIQLCSSAMARILKLDITLNFCNHIFSYHVHFFIPYTFFHTIYIFSYHIHFFIRGRTHF